MNDSRRPSTYTLARLYETQGHAGRAGDIYRKLASGTKQDIGAERQFSGTDREDETAGSEQPSELALLMGQWIDLLRRRRFFETKS